MIYIYKTWNRFCLEREWIPVETDYGSIRMKMGRWRGEETTASPEYEDVLRLARERAVPVKTVHQAKRPFSLTYRISSTSMPDIEKANSAPTATVD